MPHYLLFGYDRYYAYGGMSDCLDKYQSLTEVIDYIAHREVVFDYYEILDLVEMKVYDISVDVNDEGPHAVWISKLGRSV